MWISRFSMGSSSTSHRCQRKDISHGSCHYEPQGLEEECKLLLDVSFISQFLYMISIPLIDSYAPLLLVCLLSVPVVLTWVDWVTSVVCVMLMEASWIYVYCSTPFKLMEASQVIVYYYLIYYYCIAGVRIISNVWLVIQLCLMNSYYSIYIFRWFYLSPIFWIDTLSILLLSFIP